MLTEELHNLYISPDINGDQIKEDQLGGSCSSYRGDEKCIQTL